MAYHTLLKFPDPRLKEVSSTVKEFDVELVGCVNDLYDTLNVEFGAGIAAPQIGRLVRVVLVKCSSFGELSPDPYELDEDILVLINPVIGLLGNKVRWSEACLSVPDTSGEVYRSSSINVKYQDIGGIYHELSVGWPLAGAIQHECDHLDGVLYIDRMPISESAKIRRAAYATTKRITSLSKGSQRQSYIAPKVKSKKRPPKKFGKLKKKKKK
tara:strand:- start:1061 stop:1699 length:639 start_codon:yes stop_codon:yes gene_type:complete